MADDDKRWLHPTMDSPEYDHLVADQERRLEFPAGQLTDNEHECIRLLGQASTLMAGIVDNGSTRAADLAELYGHVHVLQRTIGSQAAARLYPERYRLLGSSLRPGYVQRPQEPPERPFSVPAAGDTAAMDDHRRCYRPGIVDRYPLNDGGERLTWPCGTYAEIEAAAIRPEYSPDMLLGMHDANRSHVRMVRLDVDRDEDGEALPLVDEIAELRTGDGYVLAGGEDRGAEWLKATRASHDAYLAEQDAQWETLLASTPSSRPNAVRHIVERDPANIPGVVPRPGEPAMDLLDDTPVWDREAIAVLIGLGLFVVALIVAAVLVG